ncbi:MAG TPA: OsmC family protein [Candidatus Angelobacter sp.]|nr:OsmC family protein [Candidatus Angelobacter sp.]
MIQAKVSLTFPPTLQFIVETEGGHRLIIDDVLGQAGSSPVELMAAALAGCTAFDVAAILRHKKLTAYEVSVEAEQKPDSPQALTHVRIHHAITGEDIDPELVREAIRLFESKCCSVSAMARQNGAEIKTTYSIQSERDVQAGPVSAPAA